MMSNYERTMELTSYATNSAGASQKQFEKTMESIESKLNKLSNAWEQFTTGITDQGIFKGVIDLLTGLLTVINNVTDAIDPMKLGWAKLLTAILGFKAAKGAVNGAMQTIGAQIVKGMEGNGEKGAKSFFAGFRKKVKGLGNKETWTNGKEFKRGKSGEKSNAEKKAARAQEVRLAEEELEKAKEITAEEREQLELIKKQVAAKEQDLKDAPPEKKDGVIDKDNSDNLNKLNDDLDALKEKESDTNGKIAKSEGKEAEAIERLNAAKEIEQGTTKMGILTKARYNLQLLFGSKKARENAKAQLIAAGATSLEKGATEEATFSQWLFNAAVDACPLGWIALAIGAVVGAIALYNAITETAEEKSQRLNETTEKLGELMGSTQESINDLKDSWEGLTELKNSLKDLTVGTTEWKSKLVEVNQQVLELIDKYPDLAQYVKASSTGELEIDYSGYNKVLEQQQDNLILQQQAYSFNKALYADNEAKRLRSSKDFLWATASGDTLGERNKIDLQAQGQDISKSTLFSAGLSTYLDDFEEQVKKNGDHLSEQEKIFINTSLSTEKTFKNFEKIKKDTTVDLKKYAQLSGLTEEQVKKKKEEGEITDDMIQTLLATKEWANQYEKYAQGSLNFFRSNTVTKKTKRLVEGKLTGEDIQNTAKIAGFKSANAAILDADSLRKVIEKNIKDGLVNFEDESLQKDVLREIGLSEEEIKEAQKNEADLNQIIQNYYNGLLSLDNKIKNLDFLNDKDQKAFNKTVDKAVERRGESLTTAQEEQMSGVFASIKSQGGDIDVFSENINSILDTFEDPKDIENFLDTIQNIDFSSETSIREFINNLNELGTTIDGKVTEQLINASNAAKDFDMSKLVSDLRNAKLTEMVREHIEESSKVFSDDDYKEIIEELNKKGLTDISKKFIQRGTNYVYNGDMNELLKAMSGDTSLKDAESQYEEAKKENKEKQEKLSELNKSFDTRLEDLHLTGKVDTKVGEVILSTFLNEPTAKKKAQNLSNQDFTDLMHYKTDDNGDFITDREGNKRVDYAKINSILTKVTRVTTNPETRVEEKRIDPTAAQNLPVSFWRMLDSEIDFNLADNSEILTAANKDRYSQEGQLISIIDLLKNSDIKGLAKFSDTERKSLLQEYLDEGLITTQQFEEFFDLGYDQLKEKLKGLGVSTDKVDAAKQKAIKAEETQYINMDSAREIVDTEATTPEGLQAQQDAIDGIVASYEGYEEELKRIQEQYGLNEAAARKFFALQQQADEATTKVTEILADNADILDPLSGKQGTRKYQEVVQQLVTQFKKIFGEEIDTDWVQENMSKILDFGSGNKSAYTELANTKKAKIAGFTTIAGDPNKAEGKTWKNFQTKIKTAAEAATEDVNNLTTNVDELRSALEAIDGENVSFEIKQNNRAAVAESLQDALTTMVSQYYTANSAGRTEEADTILTNIQNLINMARNNGYSVTGINVAAAIGPLQAGQSRLSSTNILVSNKEGEKKYVETEANAEGTGENKITDFDASLNERTTQYNEQYNLLNQINALETERNKLISEGNRILDRQKVTGQYSIQEIRRNMADQVANLNQQIAANQAVADSASSFASTIASTRGQGGFWYDASTQSIQINPDAIKGMTPEEYDKFSSAISDASNMASKAQTAMNNIVSAQDSIYELTKAVEISENEQYTQLQRINYLERTREKIQNKMSRESKKLYLDENKYLKLKNKEIDVLKQQIETNKQVEKTARDMAENLNQQTALQGWGAHLYYDQNTGEVINDVKWFKSLGLTSAEEQVYSDLLKDLQDQQQQIKDNQDAIDEAEEALEDFNNGLQEFVDILENFNKVIGVVDHTISMLEKRRSRLERATQQTNVNQIRDIYEQVAVERMTEIDISKDMNRASENRISEIMSKIADTGMAKYFRYDKKNHEVYTTEAYDNIDDSTLKSSVDKTKTELETQAQSIRNNLLKIEEMNDSNYSDMENLAQKYLSFQDRIFDAVVKTREENITTLTNIDNSIKNAASTLISSIQKNIQKLRQDRQNDKTAKELQETEAKLAYLQIDTSNANQKTILDTQKSLEEKQQSYTDSLIDQKITELQQQNDEAADQRKKQIDILQSQLELDKKNQVIWDYVAQIQKDGVDGNGHIRKDSLLYNLLYNIDKVNEKNSENTTRWINTLQNDAAFAQAYKKVSLSMSSGNPTASNTRTSQSNYNSQNFRTSSNSSGTIIATATLSGSLRKYAKGGLADFTGPAWLDGTKSSPELILNARDTENFIQLKDVLSDIMTHKPNKSETNGDFYFDIHIDVDKITNDYDVDKIASRIKQQITNEARYRNVNIINMRR